MVQNSYMLMYSLYESTRAYTFFSSRVTRDSRQSASAFFNQPNWLKQSRYKRTNRVIVLKNYSLTMVERCLTYCEKISSQFNMTLHSSLIWIISVVLSLNYLWSSPSTPFSVFSASPGVKLWANFIKLSLIGWSSGSPLYLDSSPKMLLQTSSKLRVGQIAFSPYRPSYFM